MEYEVRDYRPSDQDELLRFFRAVFLEMGFEFDPEKKDRDLNRITEAYQTGNGLFLLAERDEAMAGTIALRRMDEPTYELKRFYVLKERREHGLGTRLLRLAIEQVRSSAGERIRLDTTRKSQAAISLFRNHGFVDIPRFNDDPYAEIFMELTLSGTRT